MLYVYIKLLGKIFSLGPDEARSNLSNTCLSYQKIVLLLRKHIDTEPYYTKPLLRNQAIPSAD